MNKQEIVDYVLSTPENTNPTILRQMLSQLAENGDATIDYEEIEKFIQEYLQANPPTIETDTTMSKSGFAADAAAVGERLKDKANMGTTLSEYGIIDGISTTDTLILNGGTP